LPIPLPQLLILFRQAPIPFAQLFPQMLRLFGPLGELALVLFPLVVLKSMVFLLGNGQLRLHLPQQIALFPQVCR